MSFAVVPVSFAVVPVPFALLPLLFALAPLADAFRGVRRPFVFLRAAASSSSSERCSPSAISSMSGSAS